jgi:hypothetical protein
LNCLSTFLTCIDEDEQLSSFKNVFGVLLEKSIDVIKSNEDDGLTAINSINEVIEAHPKFVKPYLNDLVNIFTEIISAKQLNDSLRITSLYGIQ